MTKKHEAQVRLSELERNHILSAVVETALAIGAKWNTISLFGSRAVMTKRGGDIDLYIKIDPTPDLVALDFKNRLKMTLFSRLGEQKIDLVIDDGIVDLGPFGAIVLAEKVDLWTRD